MVLDHGELFGVHSNDLIPVKFNKLKTKKKTIL